MQNVFSNPNILLSIAPSNNDESTKRGAELFELKGK